MPDDSYVSCKDTAVLVRAALRKAFPEAVFSVRSRIYSMGSEITVAWTDGPPAVAVDEVVQRYAGYGFDGMTDTTTVKYDWLYEDGQVLPLASGIGHSSGTSVTTADRAPLPAGQVNDYMAAVMLACRGETTRLYDPASDAFARGTADAAVMTESGARLVHFAAGAVITRRALSAELTAQLEAEVAFLGGARAPFDGARRYEFSVGSRSFSETGRALVFQLSGVDPKLVDAALQREAERRAGAALAACQEGNGSGYYVSVINGQQHGLLLGPYQDRPAAEADIPAGQALAEQVNSRAVFYRYGVTMLTAQQGQDLVMGRLEALPARQMALAGFTPAPAASGLVAAYRHGA